MIELLSKKISELSFISFDTETSGAYPIKDDVVEFAAIKWEQGEEIDRLEFLFKPREKMSDFIIGIHGITNEMVENAPPISEKIKLIRDFFLGSIAVAHHAPFDLGFLTVDFEKNHLSLPSEPALCTSLLARKLIHGVENHKLQTLVRHFGFESKVAHRAYEDARVCFLVFQKCLSLLKLDMTLEDVLKIQGKKLFWNNYSVIHNTNENIKNIITAIEKKKKIEMLYKKGQKKNEIRLLFPLGLVRSPDGDYIQAFDPSENKAKRFLTEFISQVNIIL